MARTESLPMPVGTPAPPFTLPDTRGNQPVAPRDFAGSPLLVVFMCNHCPFVVHLLDPLVALAAELQERGIRTVAISANDIAAYPQDGPLEMAALAEAKGFGFPYCFDESQDVARAYDAVCTPDIYLFDADHRLFYRGQFDETRPGKGQAHGGDLRAAAEALLAGEAPPTDPPPSVGCSIKWKPGS